MRGKREGADDHIVDAFASQDFNHIKEEKCRLACSLRSHAALGAPGARRSSAARAA